MDSWLNGNKVVEYDLWSDEWKALKTAGKWADMPHYGEAVSGQHRVSGPRRTDHVQKYKNGKSRTEGRGGE